VDVAGRVDDNGNLVALGQPETTIRQRGTERLAAVTRLPCRQYGGGHDFRVDAGPLGLGALAGRRRRTRALHRIQPRHPHCSRNVCSTLAVQGGKHGTIVGTGRQRLALVKLRDPTDLLPSGMVVVEGHRGTVRPHQRVLAVAVLTAVLDVDLLGEGLPSKPQLDLEPGPVTIPASRVQRGACGRIGMHVVDGPCGPRVAGKVAQFGDLVPDVVGHESPRRAHADLLATQGFRIKQRAYG